MAQDPQDVVSFRLSPPVAMGAPLFVGWLATLFVGDAVDLGGWRVPLGSALVLLFAAWNGWSLWLFGKHGTGVLPGQPTGGVHPAGGAAPARAVRASYDDYSRRVRRWL